jgi:hypothetical protein
MVTEPVSKHELQGASFREVVGCLSYLAQATRPDICHAVRGLSRYQDNPTSEAWMAAKRVLRYLRGTQCMGIHYGSDAEGMPRLVGYADASWGSCPITRRSTTGYIFSLGGAITWRSQKQAVVALSTAEAEYMAASSSVQEAVWLRGVLNDAGVIVNQPTVIYEDNQACIEIIKNPKDHGRTKHIDIRYHFIRDKVLSGDVEFAYVQSNDQVADILTKALAKPAFVRLREMIPLTHSGEC